MTTPRNITADEYVALQQPRTPSFEGLFEFERTTLAEKELAPRSMFDRFAKEPRSGLFIIVPPQPAPADKLDWSELMARVKWKGKQGQNYLDPKHLTDKIEVLDVPTMLTGVEDGRSRTNIRPMDSREILARERRTAYTVWRGYIHVVLFTEVLQHHGLDILSSRYLAIYVPNFFLHDGGPTLYYNWEDNANPKWGAPSCGSVER